MPARNLWDTVLGNVSVTFPGSISGVPPTLAGFNNLTATTDPGTSNDQTQGYSVGSMWLNTAAGALRVWICRNAATGAAAWAFLGADYVNGGSGAASEATQFGAGTALISQQGNINVQANAGTFVGGTGADIVMATFTIPANTFNQANRGVEIKAAGSFLANGNTKTVKINFNPSTAVLTGTVGNGGTIIASTGAITTGGSGWFLTAQVFKYGILASNTQVAISQDAQNGSTTIVDAAPQLVTAVEANPILVALTGNAATSLTDITWNLFQVNAMN